MCGRYAFHSPHLLTQQLFGVTDVPPIEPRWNIAPTQYAPVIRIEEGARRVRMLRWGLVPGWAKDVTIGQRMINARVESAHEKPAFRSAWKRRRCLIPADGWYEWQVVAGRKQPQFLSTADGSPLAFAGLWEHWDDKASDAPPEERSLETYTILTRDAVPALSHVHDRMPCVVPAERQADWLAAETPPEALVALLDPQPSQRWRVQPASLKVNSPRNEGPSLLEPDRPPPANGSLFDD